MAVTDLNVPRGGAKTFRFTLTDSGGSAIDLSNLTALKFRAKDDIGDADTDALIDIDINLSDPDHDLANGQFVLKLLEAHTSSLSPGQYHYDFRAERSSGTSPFKFPSPTGKLTVEAVVNVGS